jgi:hypothetical protein
MNKIPYLLALTAAVASLTLNLATAQTNSASVTNAATISGGWSEIWNAMETSGLSTATNYAAEPYLTYAPSAPTGNQVGGGIFVAYNVSSYLGTGLGFDYLGQFSLVSANLQIKVATHPLAFLGASWATNVAVAPFALVGVGTPLSGAGNGAIAVTDAGAYVQYGTWGGGKFNIGTCVGKWSNAGSYSGTRYHFFIGWSKGF